MSGDTSAQPPPEDGSPKRLGKYVIDRKIGQGGMGAVYLGRDSDLKRQVALKVLPRDKAENPTLVKRFKAEAQAAAQLRHENIVAVYDSGEADGYLYIAMEYIDGKDLYELIRKRGRIPINRSIQMIKEVASALQHAHEQNIVHRDIKPSNLLIRLDGKVKLTDLGLARSIDDTLETNITRAGTTVGTVDYMAPEQARNSKLADIRSDLYSLGCTWFHMLTGQAPYPEGSVTNKLQAHAIRPIPNARDLNPKIPEGIVAVLNRLMAKKPEDRYQSPAELLADLEQSRLSRGAVGDEIMGSIEEEERDEAVRRGEPPPEPSGRKFSRLKDSDSQKGSLQSLDEEDDDDEDDRRYAATEVDEAPVESRSSRKSRKERQRSEPDEPEAAGPVPEESGKRPKGKPERSATEGKSRNLPPKRQPLEPTEEREGLNIDRLKPVGAVLGVIALVLGLGWVVSNYATSFFFGGPSQAVTDPFAAQRERTAILGNEPGGAAGGPQMSNPADLPGATTGSPSANAPGATAAANNAAGTPAGTDGPDGAAPGTPFDPTQIPAWAAGAIATNGLKTVTVSSDGQQKGDQPSLAAAVKFLGDRGGRVQVLGSGILTLSGKLATTAVRLVIEAADPKQRPVVVCEANSASPGLGLEMSRGTLELQGLHFAANAADLPGTEPVSLVAVVDGQLQIRDCSFTVSGTGMVPVQAIALETRTDPTAIQPLMRPQALIERTIVRGEAVTALAVLRQFADVVVRQSVLVSATSPVVVLSSSQRFVAPERESKDPAGSAGLPTTPAGPQRTVRFVESTLVTGKAAVRLMLNGSGVPPLTNFVFQDSVCCTANRSETVLLDASQWPPQHNGQDAGQLQDVTWSSTNSLYLGYGQLVDPGTATSFRVTDAASWQRFWGKKFDAEQFQAAGFPAAAPEDWAQTDVAILDRDRIPPLGVTSASGQPPGCETASLSLPDHVSQVRIRALAERKQSPSQLSLASSEPPQVLRVDLLKEDLGVVLGRNQWPSGTLIEATGSGNRTMTPVKIEGKGVRIVFRQVEGSPPLLMQPRVTDGRAGPQALITVEKGGLELVGASLAQLASTREGVPEHLIVARDSQLLIRQCQLMGPAVDGAQHRGLIRWISSEESAVSSNPPVLVIADSLLYSPGHLIRAEGAAGNLFLRNSILVARGLGLDLAPTRVGDAVPLTVDIRRCTLAATQSAIRVEPIQPDGDVRRPFRLYVDETAFAGPFVVKNGEAERAAVLLCDAAALQRNQVEWWGRANGVAPEIQRFLGRDGDVQNSAGTLAEWQAALGADRDVQLLTGDQGVYYATPLSTSYKSIKPQAFALHRSAKASTWGDGGRPIGAETSSVGPDGSPSLPGDAGPKPPPAGGNTKPGSTKKPLF